MCWLRGTHVTWKTARPWVPWCAECSSGPTSRASLLPVT